MSGGGTQPGQSDVVLKGIVLVSPSLFSLCVVYFVTFFLHVCVNWLTLILGLMPQQQAMNLKLPTGHIQVANISQAGKVPTMMGTRPAMVISSPQLRAGAPMLSPNMAQLNVTQALAQVILAIT